jgi:hypothetical protein
MAQTDVSHLRAVGERDFFELGAAFAYLSKCYVTYDPENTYIQED